MDDLTQRAWVFFNLPRELRVHHLFLLVLSVWYYSSPMAIKLEIFNFLPPETLVLLELVLVYLSQMVSWIVCAANRKVVSKGWHQSCDDLNKRAGKCPNKIFLRSSLTDFDQLYQPLYLQGVTALSVWVLTCIMFVFSAVVRRIFGNKNDLMNFVFKVAYTGILSKSLIMFVSFK